MRLHDFYSLLLPWIIVLALATRGQAIHIKDFNANAGVVLAPFDRVFGLDALDFWKEIKLRGAEFKNTIEKAFQDGAEKIPQAAVALGEFKLLMAQAVNASNRLRDDMQRTVHNISDVEFADISGQLSNEFNVVLEDFKGEFSLPLPEDQDARYAQRKEMISWVMRKVEEALVRVLVSKNVAEADVRARFSQIEPKITNAVLISGKLVDNHPILINVLIYAGLVWIVPEYWLLKPLLRLFGFGPSGPVKGSAAAWAQSRFFGGNVVRASWFAWFQSIAMNGKSLFGAIGVGLKKLFGW